MKLVERGMTIIKLREMFDLDSTTGMLRWRERPIHHFNETPGRTALHSMRRTNSRHAGTIAFTSRHQLGYLRAELGGMLWQAHRVVFALFHGRFPENEVDHINGDPSDNRPENLREATHRENMRNSALRVDNKYGHPGVETRGDGKWRADLRAARKRHLGTFGSLEDAVAARKMAEKKLGFHRNHGRSAA